MRIDPMDFYKGMNQSVRNRNAALEEQGRKLWEFQQRKQAQELAQGDVTTEQGGLMNDLLRAKAERMRQPMPDFYGGSGPAYSAPQFGEWDNLLRDAFAKRPAGGGGVNMLAQFLRGMR